MSTLKKIAIGLLAVVILLIGSLALAAALVDLDGLINDQIAKRKPDLEKELGRSVDTGRVTTSMFPSLGGRIEQVKIAADGTRPEDDEPLVQVGSLGFEVSLWDALISGGKKITIKRVFLDGLKVSVVRYKGGRRSFEDITERQASGTEADSGSQAAAKEKPSGGSEPMSPGTQQILRDLSIGEVRISDARFRLVDYDTERGEKAESLIQKFNLSVRDVQLGKTVKVQIDAALFNEEKNFEFETSVGPLPESVDQKGTPTVQYVKLQMKDVDLSRLAPYLGSAPARIESTLASADWQIGEIADGKPITVKGFFALQNVRLEGGKPFDARLESDLQVLADRYGIDISKLELKIGTVQLAASGALRTLTTEPTFKDFNVKAMGLNPEVLFGYFPEARKGLEPGTKLTGDIGVDLTATGTAERQTLKGTIDLTPVEILLPDTLRKPAGTRMAFVVDGDFTRADAELRRFGFVLDELDVKVAGKVKNFSNPTFDLTADAPPFSIDRLARLMPSLHRQLVESKTSAAGKGALSAKLKGTQSNLDAALELAFTGVKLQVPSTHIEGDLSLVATLKGNPAGEFTATSQFDADKATVRVDGSLDKRPGTPMSFVADVMGTEQRLDIRRFDVRLAELNATARGGVDRKTNAIAIDAVLAPLDLEKLAKTVTSLPADKVKKSTVAFKAKVTGDSNQPSSMVVALSDFDAKLGRSDLRGTMTVRNLDSPEVQMQLASNLLDVDELYPPKEKTSDKGSPGGGGGGGSSSADEDDPDLKKHVFTGDFRAKKMLYRGDEFTDVRCAVSLRFGVATLETCALGVYGGRVDASGTRAEIWRGKMPFKAVLQVKDVELDRALTAHTQYGGLIQGKTNMAVNLSGQGFETADLEKFLTGELGMGMAEGRLMRAQVTESVAGKVASVGKVGTAEKLANAGAIKSLAAQFTVEEGKFKLKQPVTTSIDGNKVNLDGAIGIGGKLALNGTYFMSAKSLGTATGGRCSGAGEMALPLKIEGAVSSPTYGLDSGILAKEVAARCLAGSLGSALKDKLGIDLPTNTGDAQRRAREEADRVKAEFEAKARAETDAKRAQAEAAARAEADKARAEAERRAAEERRKAEEAAKKKAADSLKGMFK